MSRRRNKNRSNIKLMDDQPSQVSINASQLAQADSVTCESCGNHTFIGVMMMKRISPILSPTGKEAVVPIQTFACNACGFVNKEFLPSIPDGDEKEA
tara:strand:- start:157 stop:447 length:291 start_codon:yes stop_codon:yes gene_type:complete